MKVKGEERKHRQKTLFSVQIPKYIITTMNDKYYQNNVHIDVCRDVYNFFLHTELKMSEGYCS